MAGHRQNSSARTREPLVLEAIPENLLREPVEYIFADHYRLRQITAALDRLLGEGAFALPLVDDIAADMTVIRGYLVNELAAHIADEEEGLFPAIERRCASDHDTKQILATLRQEHVEDFEMLPPVVAGLENLQSGKALAEREQFEAGVARFVETQRRHIIWENNIVLPLARRHLNADDMAAIGRNMAARRGIDYPG